MKLIKSKMRVLKSMTLVGLFVLLFISSSVLVVLAKKPLCLDSNLISRIEKWGSHGKSVAFACTKSKWIPFDESFQNLFPDLERKLRPLESLLGSTSANLPKVEVILLENEKDTIRIQSQDKISRLYISKDFWFQSDIWLESLARIWVRTQNATIDLKETVLEGAFANFLQLEAGGGQRISTPWIQNLRTSQDRLVAGSVSSSLGTIFFESLKTLSVAESTQVQAEIPRFLETAGNSEKVLREDEVLPGLVELTDQVERTLIMLDRHQAKSAASNLAWEKWVNAVHSRFQGPKSKFIDLILIGSDLENQTEELLNAARKLSNPQNSWALVSGGRIYFSGASEGLPLNLVPPLRSFQLTYLGCKDPSFDFSGSANPTNKWLTSLLGTSEKVFLGHFCGTLSQVHFGGLLKGGFQEFAKENPNMSFVQMHPGSLPKEMLGKTSEIMTSVLNKKWEDPALLGLGWERPQWDQQIRAFRARSVIDAVQAFR